MKIAILMGSTSDMPIVQKAIELIESFGIEYEKKVLSAHRTPIECAEYIKKNEENTAVFIAFAGMAAHLAGAVAANTIKPVIGVPVESGALKGLDALYSTVQMPPGVPVATVGINAGKNAALLAMQMMAINDKTIADKLKKEKENMREKILNTEI